MSDRELLEAAAKAAGYDDAEFQDMAGWGEVRYGFSEAIWSKKLYDEDGSGYWNPLVDDGAALRLAVKLGITMYPAEGEHDGATTTWAHPDSEWIVVDRTADPAADMRRAIVRAAASLAGK